MNPFSMLAIGCGFAALPFLSLSTSGQDPAGGTKVNRYIGAQMCKNCHSGSDKGEHFEKWGKTEHAKAFETLASPKAKEIAAKLKIEDPQKAEQCVKCHVTAHGVPPAEIKKGFKMENGVQCESCHGPGENHYKIRFAEASKGGAPSPITADEIVVGKRDAATCQKCHNADSPTYQPFCLKERMQKIEHLTPGKKRSEEELKKLRETCSPDCKKCGEKKEEKKDEKK
jgi:hypothetical protein